MSLLNNYKGTNDPEAFRKSLKPGVAPPLPVDAFKTPSMGGVPVPTGQQTPQAFQQTIAQLKATPGMSVGTGSVHVPANYSIPANWAGGPPPRTPLAQPPMPQATPVPIPQAQSIANGSMPQGKLSPEVFQQHLAGLQNTPGVSSGNGVPVPSQTYSINTPVPTGWQGTQQTGAPSGSPTISTPSIQSEAAAKIAKLRAGIERAVTGAKAGLKNTFDYNNQISQGNRALRNFDLSQRGDQFGGSAREDRFRIQREDGINDTFTNNQFAAQNATYDKQLADFETLAPEQQDAMYNELLRIERQFNLQEGGLTGVYNGQRTLQGQQLDNDERRDARDFGYQESRDIVGDQRYNQQFGYQQQRDSIGDQRDERNFNRTITESERNFRETQKNNNYDAALKLTQLYGVPVDPKMDYGLLIEQVSGLQPLAVLQFEQEKQRYGAEMALKKIAQDHGITMDQAKLRLDQVQTAISQQNANTSASAQAASNSLAREKFNYDKDPKNIDNRYKESQIEKNNSPTPKTTDYKTSPEFASDVSYLQSNPSAANKLNTNAETFIKAYGYDGYLALRKASGIDKED